MPVVSELTSNNTTIRGYLPLLHACAVVIELNRTIISHKKIITSVKHKYAWSSKVEAIQAGAYSRGTSADIGMTPKHTAIYTCSRLHHTVGIMSWLQRHNIINKVKSVTRPVNVELAYSLQ